MEIGQEITIYVKARSNGEWFGGWAPVRLRGGALQGASALHAIV